MSVVAGLIVAFTIMQLIVAAINLIFPLKIKGDDQDVNELVSVMIPVRNESSNIISILTDLQSQAYKNIEILVFNDQSNDNTENIVSDFARTDMRIKLINSAGLPEGWLGKNYGCHTMAQYACGSYFLFIDADVRIKNNIITSAVAHAIKNKYALVSIFPSQAMITFDEWITVPLMNYILLSLLPLVLVHASNRSALAAANGQFMLFKADVYKKYLPHKVMKNKMVEDIEIARFLKSNNEKISCIASETDVQCRMYNNFNEAVQGFSKNVFSFFGNSFLLSLLFWLITTFGFIPVIIYMPVLIIKIYLITVILIRIFTSLTSHQHVLLNLLLLLPQQITLGIINYLALMNKIKRRYVWKGRKIE